MYGWLFLGGRGGRSPLFTCVLLGIGHVMNDDVYQSGMETTMFFSATRTHVFIKIRCPLERLKEEADR